MFKYPVLAIMGLMSSIYVNSQSIGTFNSIQPTAQSQYLVLPSSHKFQRIIKTGDALSAGGNLGGSLDFTGYVPIGGSSTNGYLSISSETYPAEVAILNIAYNGASKTWGTSSSGKVDFPQADIGLVRAFCSGTVTPRNTVMVCEENDFSPFETNGDGYEDFGWVIEIDPATRTVINQDGVGGVDKLWALGRNRHENVAIKNDETVLYWGGDDVNNGFIYKFVPSVPANYTAGNLYVLQTTGALGTGTWQLIPNTTIAERNSTVASSHSAGGYNFDRVEDVEIAPDGKIYFAVASSGNIIRFRDLGATVDQMEAFVTNTAFDVDGAGPYAPEPWGVGVDNLAFDGEGNLWVLQDGDRSHIWVVAPTHSAATPAVKLFATTPAGCEPTGITFSPDYKFLFMSIMHPDPANTATQTDAAGVEVTFNTHTTIVVSRAENLGIGIALPLRFTSFEAVNKGKSVELKWSATGLQNHHYFEVERSVDGEDFYVIGKNKETSSSRFSYTDNDLPNASKVYYRIKSSNHNGEYHYSAIKNVSFTNRLSSVYPVPVNHVLHADYTATATENISINIYNEAGMLVHKETKKVVTGKNKIAVGTNQLSKGTYLLTITGSSQLSKMFTKL